MAYTTYPSQLRDGKLAPTARTAIMVGYDTNRKAYRLFDPTSQTIFSSNQVIFDEKVFPFKNSELTKINKATEQELITTTSSIDAAAPGFITVSQPPDTAAATDPDNIYKSDHSHDSDDGSFDSGNSDDSIMETDNPIAPPDELNDNSNPTSDSNTPIVNNEDAVDTSNTALSPVERPSPPATKLSNDNEISDDPMYDLSHYSNPPSHDAVEILRNIITTSFLEGNPNSSIVKIVAELHGKEQTIK